MSLQVDFRTTLTNSRARGDALRAYLDQDQWHSDIRDLVEACPEEALFDWKLVFRNPKPNWVSPDGRVVQLGDAAHTFLPSSGNGATQAMEDGVSLSSCLQLAGREQTPLAARVHNKLRYVVVTVPFGLRLTDPKIRTNVLRSKDGLQEPGAICWR